MQLLRTQHFPLVNGNPRLGANRRPNNLLLNLTANHSSCQPSVIFNANMQNVKCLLNPRLTPRLNVAVQ